jgi:hypothetical protein
MLISQFFHAFKMLCFLFGDLKSFIGDFLLETLYFFSFLFKEESFFLIFRASWGSEKRILIKAKA